MRVGVIGTGYVGLVTGACLAAIGHRVTCVDRLTERVDTINKGLAPFYEPGLSELVARLVRDGNLSATSDLAATVQSAALSIVAVGTPGDGERIDLSQVVAAAQEIGHALAGRDGYHVVAMKSTVVPGTTDGPVREAIEGRSGRRAGPDFGLCMNPETLREGSAVADFMAPDRIIIGRLDVRSGAVLEELYAGFDCPKPMVGLRDAELIKYASNLLLATLISYSNELAALCEATPGVDIDTVMDSVHLDRRLAPIVDGRRITPGIVSFLRAGAGFGGSCLPKDVNALRVFARERAVTTPLLDAVISVNRHRPEQLIVLAEGIVGALANRQVTVLGLAFKPGTDDIRDSAAIALIDGLLSRQAIVRAFDPMCMGAARRIFGERVAFADAAFQALEGSEAAIIATAWPDFAQLDWNRIASAMANPVVIDGRNAFRRKMPTTIKYYTIGRNYP